MTTRDSFAALQLDANPPHVLFDLLSPRRRIAQNSVVIGLWTIVIPDEFIRHANAWQINATVAAHLSDATQKRRTGNVLVALPQQVVYTINCCNGDMQRVARF